jgi:hypothetical protein
MATRPIRTWLLLFCVWGVGLLVWAAYLFLLAVIFIRWFS